MCIDVLRSNVWTELNMNKLLCVDVCAATQIILMNKVHFMCCFLFLVEAMKSFNLISASSPVRGPQVGEEEGVWLAGCHAVVSDVVVVVAAGCFRGWPSLPSCAPSALAAPGWTS